MSAFASFAPAKLNLSLHVGAPEADGFHPLSSLVAFAHDVGDTITAAPADALSLTITGPFASALMGAGVDQGADNLVIRAANALAQAAGVKAKAALRLDKRLPIASGIGGGSSDAAAALRVCARLWDVGAAPDDLAAIAAKLGSDVPSCLAAETVLMEGRGERLTPFESPRLHAVLVNPLVEAPTGAVYRAFDAAGFYVGAPMHPPLPLGASGAAWTAFLATMRNDLIDAAITVAPAIASVMKALRRAAPDALVCLSGSGATAYALHADPQPIATAAQAMRAHHPEWWIAVTELGSVDVAVKAI